MKRKPFPEAFFIWCGFTEGGSLDGMGSQKEGGRMLIWFFSAREKEQGNINTVQCIAIANSLLCVKDILKATMIHTLKWNKNSGSVSKQ